jgi:acyl-coenzyme A synthetase/AMP-(fatty) acid ligase
MSVVDQIFAHARATPRKIALTYNGETQDYSAFATAILRARRVFEQAPLDRDRPALLCINNLRDIWIAGLALRSLGVTTAPGREAEDVARLGLGAVNVVTTPAESWPDLEAATVRAGGRLFRPAIDARPDMSEPAFEEPAESGPPGGHILMTSATTGTYKKVLIDAKDEARNTPGRIANLGITGESTIAVFEFGNWTAIGYQWPVSTWTAGGGVVIQQGPDPFRSLATPGVTHVFTHPQLLEALLAAPEEVALRDDGMMLIVGGGVLPSAHWRAARERLTRDVRTIVGSTEVGTFALTAVEEPDDLQWHELLPTHEVQVVDEGHRPAGVGEVGAIRIRTNGVEAYLGDPFASAAFFRDGWFYPGDLGVFRKDGRLALQGRLTDVINVMGSKYAAAPIEAELLERLDLEAVCVFSAPGEAGEEVHVAVQPKGPISAADLKDALLAALPPMTGVKVHAVQSFPRNHMGKIERAVLKSRLLGAASVRADGG